MHRGEDAYVGGALAKKVLDRIPLHLYNRGKRLKVNWRGLGEWLPCTVDRFNLDGTVSVRFDDGTSESRVPCVRIKESMEPMRENPVPNPNPILLFWRNAWRLKVIVALNKATLAMERQQRPV